ncbi:Predicted nucleotidyltransferase [Geoalkalibacter ferrihydriticus]|uniref:Predicted nucleotidyltransferase n=1 Tax=Geoalkalibacter ferrihydriticus TaxID=392333 RepID=A0A1G9VFH0_9BACT|nr:nucleotidyltransferase domain-containing protein [Geoalkalibacter ferrihydriticus]SDM70879.1 Predicted nucleotidyltransferase [Geoalkalibacter ferrihydriticus]
MASEQDLNKIRQIIVANLKEYPVRIFLFGSHATGRAAITSDIDVAVFPEKNLPAGLLSQIREEIENSNVPYPVDLVDLSQADEDFRQRVLKEGIEWTA